MTFATQLATYALFLALGGIGVFLLRMASWDRSRRPETVPPTPQRVTGPVHVVRIVPGRPAMPSGFLLDPVTCPQCGKEGCTPGPDGLPLAHSLGRGRDVKMCGCGRPKP